MRQWTAEELGQIRADYRQAKNKNAQIDILADLNDCSRSDVLRALGIDSAGVNRQKAKQREEIRAEAVQRVLNGESKASVAKSLGVCVASVSSWMKQAKDEAAEFMSAQTLKSFAEVTAEAEAATQPAPEPKHEPAPVQDITRLLQIKAGLHCFTELLDGHSNLPDGYLTDLHDLLVSDLDDEIEKLEALYL